MTDAEDVRIEFANQQAAVPDAFARLWTPHRMVYIHGQSKPATPDAADCPFCASPERSDEDGLIVHRGETCYVLMNLYPYSPGHVLVCPYRHISWYWELTTAETAEFAAFTQHAMRVLRESVGVPGFNVGINQGAVAGAGIAAHLHQHVVPRWQGDSNFLPIIGQTKAVPELLGDTRQALAEAWGSLDA